MIMPEDLHPLGIGTWGIAGFLHHDQKIDTIKQLSALTHMHSKGMNYIDCSLKYADGQTLNVIAQLLDRVGRDTVFITAKLEKSIERPEDIHDQVDIYRHILKTDYIDQVQLHAPSFTKLSIKETYAELAKLVDSGKIRYVGASNFSIPQLMDAVQGSGLKLLTHESLFNFSFRQNEDAGILDFCQQENIKFVAYQPLHRTKTVDSNFELLVDLSQKYNVSQSQIILNWLVRKRIIPLIRSDSVKHIDENLASLHLVMDDSDYAAIDAFRVPEIVNTPVDWSDSGQGASIYQLANLF